MKAYFVTPLHHFTISNFSISRSFASFFKISQQIDGNERNQQLKIQIIWLMFGYEKQLGRHWDKERGCGRGRGREREIFARG